MTDRAKKWLAVVAVAVLVVGALVLIGIIQGPRPRTSYTDGYQWGYRNAGAHTAPVCSRTEMTSARAVSDPHFPSARPTGDGRPRDNFAQWRAGCRAGAKAELRSS